MTELEKFIEIEENWNKLKAFLEWTQQQNWQFMIETDVSDYEKDYYPFPYKTNDEVCAAYFGIDLGQLEYEKEQLWQAQKEQIRGRKKGTL